MNRIVTFSTVIVFQIFTAGCTKSNNASELGMLKMQHAKEQQAHLANNVSLFKDIFDDTLCQTKNGEVSYLTREQVIGRFENYFTSVEFVKWEDVKEPVYTLSADATLAHILVQKHVELIDKNDSTRAIQKTDFAWAELWKKINGQWKLYSITSTDKIDK
ncbi:MAG: hypothetical protein HOP37_02910 [Cyclobacteriaceae bacterium]|nr:hypothetical protein [Cyclobacteriaceae bacterium]